MAVVSVITPTYNRADFLPYAVESVLGQTHRELELLLVDDGSTDNTPDVVSRYTSDPRLKFFRQANAGQAVARNVGLRNSTGDFICFLDSDNVWLKDKLARQLRLMEQHPTADIIYGDQQRIDENGTIVTSAKSMTRYSGRITNRLLIDNCVSFNTTMTRRRCFTGFSGFDESVRAGDDYDLWLRLSVSCEFLYVPKLFGQYRVMSDQISTNKERRFSSNKAIIERFLVAHPDLLSRFEERRLWSIFYSRRARHRLKDDQMAATLQDIRLALKTYPLHAAPWRVLAKLLLNNGQE